MSRYIHVRGARKEAPLLSYSKDLGFAYARLSVTQTSQPDMQDHKHQPYFNLQWEFVDDPHADEILRRAITLILNDAGELSTEDGFDKDRLTGLNEGVPVESEKTNSPKS